MPMIELPSGLLIAANFLGWFVIQAGAGIVAQRLSPECFARDRFLYRTRVWERGGELWQCLFRVRAWKHLLPDGARVFRSGFRKKSLQAFDSAYLEAFIRESRRAELTHWMVLPFTGVFFLFNPPAANWVMVAYALASNAPCIIAQRYNRPRFQRILDRRAAHSV